MEKQDLLHLTLPGYILGSSFCRKDPQTGGVCIFVGKDLSVNKIDISHNYIEKDLEMCAVELETEASKLIILSLYRAPTGDFTVTHKLSDTIKQETWESVYQSQDVNYMFNSFLSTFLNIFEASFPVKYESTNNKKNDWIMQGIKISCKHKRSLYTFTKNSSDQKAKAHYVNHCRILKK
jgi:hypothetical protein